MKALAVAGAALLAGVLIEHCRPVGTRWLRADNLYLAGLICPRPDCTHNTRGTR